MGQAPHAGGYACRKSCSGFNHEPTFDALESNFRAASNAAAATRAAKVCNMQAERLGIVAAAAQEAHMMDAPTHDTISTVNGPTAGSFRRTSELRDLLIIAVSPRSYVPACARDGGAASRHPLPRLEEGRR